MSKVWPERIDPLDGPPGIVAHHLKKYEFAREYATGLVIDLACGVGYGTDYLAPETSRIVGLDIAEEAIGVARVRYRKEHTWFVQGSAEHLPFPDRVADTVTCFEGIEHFVDPEAHLDEVTRILKLAGVYLVSTPHPGAHPHGEDNPYHLHEFGPDDLDAMLRTFFGEVSMLGQRRLQTRAHRTAQHLDVLGLRKTKILRRLARRISRDALRTAPVEETTLDDFVIEPFQEEAVEYVAVCRRPSSS